MALLILSSCSNIFYELSSRDSDKSLLFEAKILIDKRKYTEAITTVLQMTESGRAETPTKRVLASAYAARCGLDLIALIQSFQDSSAPRLLIQLMKGFLGSDQSNINDCKLAETEVMSIAASPGDRTADENLFLAFVEFAKIGSVMSEGADKDSDGVVDSTFNHCTTAGISDDNGKEVVTAFAQVLAALAAIGSTIGGSQLTNLQSVCNDIATINPSYNFCSILDVSGVTATHLTAIRGVIGTKDGIGLGSCNDTLTNCIAACL